MKEMELKKKYKMGLYGELSIEEMDSILQVKAPSGKYYDYEKIRAVLLRKLRGEISDEYFKNWLIIALYALHDDFYELSWMFDGVSFESEFSRKDVLSLLAGLKELDYKRRHKHYVRQHKKDREKVIYLRFMHCNWTAKSCVFKAYYVDYKNRRFDIRFVDDAFFEYSDDVLYCNIAYCDMFDNEDETCDDEPYELPEEKLLMRWFYNESEEWIYDHTLDFGEVTTYPKKR